MPSFSAESAEWLETDGLGGFAMGTVAGIRTRRYHALLLCAATPPTGRLVLVSGVEAWVRTPAGTFPITSQRYGPEYIHPDGVRRVESFTTVPWPRWTIRLDDGTRLQHEIVMRHGQPLTLLSWRLLVPKPDVELIVRPLLAGRDYHALHRENPSFKFEAQTEGQRTRWQPYPDLPAVIATSSGRYTHEPDWYRNFYYAQEAARGLEAVEDLASPGTFRFDLSREEAILSLAADVQGNQQVGSPGSAPAGAIAEVVRRDESERRRTFRSQLDRAADAYIVRRGKGCTIIAGYPWFTDWGRDTFIALRGLCLATGRLDEARQILVEWSATVSEGMLPNRFSDSGDRPDYNAVDASLWYIVAAYEYLKAADATGVSPAESERASLLSAIDQIITGYTRGTRYKIHMGSDGLITAGQPGAQLTWMDAKVGDWVVTPRIGKPVEIQALWYNVLRISAQLLGRPDDLAARTLESFIARFWHEPGGYLYDVVDADHRPGEIDASFRPNQIFAVGGLPHALLNARQGRRLVDAVEARLLTPLGLRTLAPGEPGYTHRYEGGPLQRDGAYHQGAAWAWLLGPFVEAWVRVRGDTPKVRQQARKRFLDPLLRHLGEAGLGHIGELADAEPPHTPRGCPFQAWSVGEALRLDRIVIAEDGAREQVASGNASS
jgi:predicted glycogen debranching enzyme